MASTTKKILYYFIGVILLLFIIQLISFIINDNLIFPNILDIIKEIFNIFSNKLFYINLLNTLLELMISLLISILLGTILGLLSGKIKEIGMIFKPIISFLRCIPIIVIIISSLIIFRNNNIIPYASLILILFPIIYQAVYEGTISINKYYIDAYRLESKFNLFIIRNVYLPLISSHSKEAFISSIGLGIKALITIEYVCGISNTIGNSIMNGVNNINYAIIYAYTIILALLIMLIEIIPLLIKRIKNTYPTIL